MVVTIGKKSNGSFFRFRLTGYVTAQKSASYTLALVHMYEFKGVSISLPQEQTSKAHMERKKSYFFRVKRLSRKGERYSLDIKYKVNWNKLLSYVHTLC